MTIPRIVSAVAAGPSRLRIRWTDGLEGVVDFAGWIATVPGMAPLADQALFSRVQLYEYGHGLFWLDGDGEEIDIAPDTLRAALDPAVASWIAEQEQAWRAQVAAE